jgi:hypothetical protein
MDQSVTMSQGNNAALLEGIFIACEYLTQLGLGSQSLAVVERRSYLLPPNT